MLEGLREAESAPPRRDTIPLLPIRSCLIRRGHVKINNRAHIPPWIPPSYMAILFEQHGYF